MSRIGKNRTSTWLSPRDYLQSLSEELYLVNDESFGVWASSASVLEPDTEGSTRNDIHEAESNCGEIDFIQFDTCIEFLLDLVEIRLKNLLYQRWDLSAKPFLRALDAVPQNQVPAQDFLKQYLRHYELHIVKGMRHHEPICDVLIVRF